MKLSIVITTRNRYSDLISCLNSIESSKNLDFDFEVIVVDDASTDETLYLSKDKFSFKKFYLIRNPIQSMMVRTRNKGARLAAGELVLFIDDDNVLDSEMIHKLVAFANVNPNHGIIGPKMCYFPSKKAYLSYQKINFFTGKTIGKIVHSGSENIESDGVPNVFMVRKKTLEECNYFDESIVQTYTEPDLAFAARLKGYKCGIVNDALTFHRNPEKRSSAHLGGNQFYQKAFFLIRNRTVMVAKYGNWYHQFIYFLLFSWVWPIAYSLSVLKEKRFDLMKLYWLGYFAGMKFFFSRKLPDTDQVISDLIKKMVKN